MQGQPTGGCSLVDVALLERVFAVVVGRGCGHRLPIMRMNLTESKVRELILELQPDFVLFQQLLALVPDVQQYDLIPANTISHSGTIATIAKKELMDDLQSKSIGRFGAQTTVRSTGVT